MAVQLSFKDSLLIAASETDFLQKNWNSKCWKNSWKELSEDDLVDAFERHNDVQSIFSALGTIVPREKKSLNRAVKKMGEQFAGSENYFKVVADLVAFRIFCKVEEILPIILELKDIVAGEKGQVCVKNSTLDNPNGPFIDKEGKYRDIFQHVYVFIKGVGYPIEFQIGHELMSQRFSMGTNVRIYSEIKKQILAKANEQESSS